MHHASQSPFEANTYAIIELGPGLCHCLCNTPRSQSLALARLTPARQHGKPPDTESSNHPLSIVQVVYTVFAAAVNALPGFQGLRTAPLSVCKRSRSMVVQRIYRARTYGKLYSECAERRWERTLVRKKRSLEVKIDSVIRR